MPVFLLAVIGGILITGFLPQLPSLHWLALPLPLVLALVFIRSVTIRRWLIPVLGFFIGGAWGVFSGYGLLDNQLADDLVGKDILVNGQIVDLPITDGRRQRIILAIQSARYLDNSTVIADFPARIQISWYDKDAPILRSGESWQFQVRLKRPRGFVNPGGFDYQVWLLRRDIGGVGYVRTSSSNQLIGVAGNWNIHAWRYALREWLLRRSDSPHKAVLLALLIGDRSQMETEAWRVMQLTGVNHLISISGLHVGFLAIAGFFLGVQLGRLLNLCFHRCPALLPGYLCAMVFALTYSALAGFNIPTQRTLIMVLAIQFVCLQRRSYRIAHVFLLALLMVVINDPLAAYDMGFWLSFGAVAVLLFSFAGRYSNSQHTSFWRRGGELLRSQWVVFIGLLLPLTLLVNSASLIAPLANLIAIPLVTFVVVPGVLMAAAVDGWFPVLGTFLLTLADYGLRVLDLWLNTLLELADDHLNPTLSLTGWALGMAVIGVILLLLPRGIAGRWLGYPSLIIALLVPHHPSPPLTLTVLDVGQGLAVVVETPEQILLYDAGPAYSEKFDAGAAILVPYLRQRGLSTLDKLVVSHNDMDHAGGLVGVLENMKVAEVIVGEPDKTSPNLLTNARFSDCHQYPPWSWGEVTFRFLATVPSLRTNANNRSCVLLIEYAGQSILLPGDIEGRVELQLVRSGELPTDLSVVLASHHGSRSSSWDEFVGHVRPVYVVYSAGFRSQHGHPHKDVVERYANHGAAAFNTATSGALSFVWRDGALQSVGEYRRTQRRYWFD